MMYKPAPEVADIAADLIETVPEHDELDGFRIVYTFIDKAPKSHGRILLGRVRKITGLSAFLARTKGQESDEFALSTSFGVMEISDGPWQALSPRQRIALVDHELSHFYVHANDDGGQELRTKGHDIEEFLGVIQRHGLWKQDVTDFALVAHEQLSFPTGVTSVPEDFFASGDAE